MSFFSYERILRGVITWRQAAVLIAMLCVLCTAFLLLLGHSFPLDLHRSIGFFVLVPLAIAALIDSVRHILPDPLLVCAAIIALCSLSFSPWSEVRHAALSAMLFLAIGLVLSRATSLGRGDAKLMGVMGLWLGTIQLVFLAIACAMVSAALYALALLLTKRAHLTSSIALGPWLVAGGFVICLFSCITM